MYKDIEVKYHGKTVGHTDINAERIDFLKDNATCEALVDLFDGYNAKMAMSGMTTGTVNKLGVIDKNDTDLDKVVGILKI